MSRSSTQYEKAWQRQIRLCRQFIKKLESTPTMHGQKWKDSMLLHYRKKLKELQKQRRKPL